MKTIEVVAAIIVRDGRVFATQRGYGDYKDMWEFPGGKMEPGETPESALVREIREELATSIAVDSFVMTVEHDYPATGNSTASSSASDAADSASAAGSAGAVGFHLTMHCYLCHVVSGSLELLEHEAARWLSPDSLMSVSWLPADLKVLPLVQGLL